MWFKIIETFKSHDYFLIVNMRKELADLVLQGVSPQELRGAADEAQKAVHAEKIHRVTLSQVVQLGVGDDYIKYLEAYRPPQTPINRFATSRPRIRGVSTRKSPIYKPKLQPDDIVTRIKREIYKYYDKHKNAPTQNLAIKDFLSIPTVRRIEENSYRLAAHIRTIREEEVTRIIRDTTTREYNILPVDYELVEKAATLSLKKQGYVTTPDIKKMIGGTGRAIGQYLNRYSKRIHLEHKKVSFVFDPETGYSSHCRAYYIKGTKPAITPSDKIGVVIQGKDEISIQEIQEITGLKPVTIGRIMRRYYGNWSPQGERPTLVYVKSSG